MKGASVVVRLLGPEEAEVLANVAPDVFDFDVRSKLAEEFLNDPRHHLAVALDGEQVVGMASGVHYIHPDQRAQLFINEVGVAPSHQRRGIGRRLVAALLSRARALGCTEAWVATEPDNDAARGLYAAAGAIEDPEPFVLYAFPLNQKGP
jgi:ribosomal protein S18 acetylase RimI-like enzyme